eukprot:IDg14868t1
MNEMSQLVTHRERTCPEGSVLRWHYITGGIKAISALTKSSTGMHGLEEKWQVVHTRITLAAVAFVGLHSGQLTAVSSAVALTTGPEARTRLAAAATHSDSAASAACCGWYDGGIVDFVHGGTWARPRRYWRLAWRVLMARGGMGARKRDG